MSTFMIMLRNVTLFILLALPGFFLVKTGTLKQEQTGGLNKLLMYIGLPMMIFSGTMKNLAFDQQFLSTSLAVIGIELVFFLFFIFVLSTPMLSMMKNRATRDTARFCAVFPNNGFLGIPLAVAVFGSDSPVVTLLILFNILTNMILYTLGIYIISGDKKAISLKKAFLNPVLIAAVAGCAANLLHADDYIPELATLSTHFSSIVTPMSMTILGMNLGSIRLCSLFNDRRMYYVATLKLIIFPCIVVGVLLLLRAILPTAILNDTLLLATFVAFAMPTAGLAPVFAESFSGDTPHAVSCTLGSTVLSILTIPLLYGLLCACLGM